MGLVLSVNTNASLIDDDMVELFAANPPRRVNITLYGASPETYGALCGSREAYARVVRAILNLQSAGVIVKLNFSVTPYNRHDAQAVYDFAAEHQLPLQAACYMFPPVRACEHGCYDADRMSPDEAAEEKVRYDLSRFTHDELRLRWQTYLSGGSVPDPDNECQELPTQKLRCRAGSSTFWVTWDQQMRPCGMMTEPSVDLDAMPFQRAGSGCTRCARRSWCPRNAPPAPSKCLRPMRRRLLCRERQLYAGARLHVRHDAHVSPPDRDAPQIPVRSSFPPKIDNFPLNVLEYNIAEFWHQRGGGYIGFCAESLQKLRSGWLREFYQEALWIWAYIRRYRLTVVIHVLLALLSTALGLGTSVASKYLIDAVTGHKTGSIGLAAAVMAGMMLTSILLRGVCSRIGAKINIRVRNEIQAEVYHAILHTAWEPLEDFRSGDLLSRLTGDVDTVAGSVTSFAPGLVSGLAQFTGALVIMLCYDPTMALIALISIPVSVLLSRLLVGRMRDHSRK